MNSWRLPEIYKYRKLELSGQRIILSIATVNIALLCLAVAIFNLKDVVDAAALFAKVAIGVQMLILAIYGLQRVSVSIAGERADKTWDFQRITPLTSLQVTLGKMIGAPIHVYFLAALFLPWIVITLSFVERSYMWEVIRGWMWSLSFIFLFLNLGLMSSAYTTNRKNDSRALGFGLLGFFLILPWMVTFVRPESTEGTILFFNRDFPRDFFWTVSFLAFGLWAFFAAKWRVAQDFLERAHFWHFPAFLIFYFFFLFGLGEGPADKSVTWFFKKMAFDFSIPAFIYVAGFLNSEKLDDWKTWLTRKQPMWFLDRSPLWLRGVIVLGLLTIFSVLTDKEGTKIYSATLIFLFTTRDLIFLQICRFTRSRAPEGMAAIYIILAYLLPGLLMGVFKAPRSSVSIFLPLADYDSSLLMTLAPVTIQVLVLGAICASMAFKSISKHE